MKNELNTLLEAIKADYVDWDSRSGSGKNPQMVADFADALHFKIGKKYIKVIKGTSVWGFIVNTENDKQFKMGDILKAAGWNAPARNQARGNILDGGYTVRWTGPLYL